MPLVQVGHDAREELDVGAAHANSVDVDDNLASACHRVFNVVDGALMRSGDHERFHRVGDYSLGFE